MSLIKNFYTSTEFFIFTLFVLGIGLYLRKLYKKRKITSLEQAVNIIQNQPCLTWRPKYFSSGNSNGNSRDGFWVTRFKPIHMGAIAYVIFYEKSSNQSYLLMTLQNRIINKKSVLVCEPPGGFYNREYSSNIPHSISEASEKEIEKQIKLNKKNVNCQVIYNYFTKRYNQGYLSKEAYQVDDNLWATAYREISEETGLNIKIIKKNDLFAVSEFIIGEIDQPEIYISIRQINISGEHLIALPKKNNDEIMHNEWIKIQNIDLEKNSVKTSKGIYLLNPNNKISYTTKILINNLTNSNLWL